MTKKEKINGGIAMANVNIKNLIKNNSRVLEVKYLGPTNTQGARVKIIDTYFNESIIIGWNYEFNNMLAVALDYLLNKKGLNIKIIGISENYKTKNDYLTINFDSDRIK